MRTVLVVALALLSGCFNPDDILPVHGSVTSPDAQVGQPVRLLRDSLVEGGSSCSEARPFKDTVTDEAGLFSFDVFRAQAQKLTGFGQFCFRVDTAFPSGSTAFSDIQRLDSELTLPAFPDWRAQPARVNGELHFEPAAPLPAEESFEGNQLIHRAVWFTDDGGVAWVADDRSLSVTTGAPQRQPIGLSDFMLEDFSGSVGLTARLTELQASVGPFGGSATTIEASSGQTLALTGARPPISRGLACPPWGTPCPWTDGDLTEVDTGVTQRVTLTLTTPVPLSAVVVRGLVEGTMGSIPEPGASLLAVLLTDADGGRLPLVQVPLLPSLWNGGAPTVVRRPRRDGGVTFEAQPDARYLVIPLDAGVPIGSVSVGMGGGIARLSEISLFE